MGRVQKEISGYLKAYLGDYGPQLYDSYSGECTSWGYAIVDLCTDFVWEELGKFGELECSYPSWFLITKRLSISEAIKKYGQITEIVVGPRGGFRGIRFGDTEFCSKCLDPRKTKYMNDSLVRIEK
jgi:hypothetical protein